MLRSMILTEQTFKLFADEPLVDKGELVEVDYQDDRLDILGVAEGIGNASETIERLLGLKVDVDPPIVCDESICFRVWAP